MCVAIYFTADGTSSFVNTEGWLRVKTDIGCLPPGFPNQFGRVIERCEYMLFEDERDAMVFKLSLK